MIVHTLFAVLNSIGDSLTVYFPVITELPWGIDSILLNAVLGYKKLSTYFTPLNTMLVAFVIYLGFKFSLIILRMIPFVGRAIK